MLTGRNLTRACLDWKVETVPKAQQSKVANQRSAPSKELSPLDIVGERTEGRKKKYLTHNQSVGPSTRLQANNSN